MSQKDKTILLIDGMNKLHASFHAYKRLSWKGESVSIIYGMPSIVSGLIFRFRPNEVMVVWDGKRSAIRESLLPGYKGDRHSDRMIDWENFELQKKEVRNIFHALGIKQILNKEAEADDMIYKMTQMALEKGYNRVIIVSSDKDFNQLLTDERVWVWNDSKNDVIHLENCKKYFGYSPAQTVDYLSLLGDKSDHIPGYPGIGKKKGPEFLKAHKSIAKFLKSEATYPGIDRKKLKEIYVRNSMLINLRVFYNANKEYLKTIFYKESNPKYDFKAFKLICQKYGLSRFMQEEFTKHFKSLSK